MTYYSIEARARKYIKWYIFLSFTRDLSSKYEKRLLDGATKVR